MEFAAKLFKYRCDKKFKINQSKNQTLLYNSLAYTITAI